MFQNAIWSTTILIELYRFIVFQHKTATINESWAQLWQSLRQDLTYRPAISNEWCTLFVEVSTISPTQWTYFQCLFTFCLCGCSSSSIKNIDSQWRELAGKPPTLLFVCPKVQFSKQQQLTCKHDFEQPRNGGEGGGGGGGNREAQP